MSPDFFICYCLLETFETKSWKLYILWHLYNYVNFYHNYLRNDPLNFPVPCITPILSKRAYLANWSLSCFLGWYCSKKPNTSNNIGNTRVIKDMTIVVSFALQKLSFAPFSLDRWTTITTAKTEKPSRPITKLLTSTLQHITFQLKTIV